MNMLQFIYLALTLCAILMHVRIYPNALTIDNANSLKAQAGKHDFMSIINICYQCIRIRIVTIQFTVL